MHPLKSNTKLVSFWQGYTVVGLGSDKENRSKGLLFVFPCTENCENVKFQNLKREIQKMRCFQFEALSFALRSSLCTRRCRQDCTKHRGGKHQLDCEQLQIITAQSLCIRITRIDNIWLKLSHSIQDFSVSFTNLRIIYLNSLNENDILRCTLCNLPFKDSIHINWRVSKEKKHRKGKEQPTPKLRCRE